MTGVLTVGECLVVARSERAHRIGGALRLSIAGAESNVAIGLARLDHQVRWCGVVGDDSFGDLVLRTLRAEGIDTFERRSERPNGTLFAEHPLPNVSSVTYLRAGSAGSTLTVTDVDAAMADPPDLTVVSGVTPALSPAAAKATRHALERTRETGGATCLAINFRNRLWSTDRARAVLAQLLDLTDVVFASAEELGLLSDRPDDTPEAIAARLRTRGVRELVVTHGSDGAEVITENRHERVAALPVPVVDTIGAGDAFTAGYLSARLDGLDLSERLARGAILGACAVASPSDWEDLPRRHQLAAVGRTNLVQR